MFFCFKWTFHSKILQGGKYGTPLQAAVASYLEPKDILKLLLNHGADPNIQGENVFWFKWTFHSKILKGGVFGSAYNAAKAGGNWDIMELLKNYKTELSSI
jgi:hypothetical protein